MQTKTFSLQVGGETLTAEFNDLAENAHGSVFLKYGDTMVLATAVMSKKPKEGGDFFPLTVDYEEKFYAIGAILGSQFVRREGRPTDDAILSGRIVDRTIRPLFDQDLRHEVQVVITVLSLGKYDPDILGVIASSLALGVSDIPWAGPVGAIRIGKMKEESDLKINCDYETRAQENYSLDIIACGKDSSINMIEVGANEENENVVNTGLKKAMEEISKIEDWQKKITKEIGKTKRIIEKIEIPESVKILFTENISDKFSKAVMSGKPGKESMSELEDEWMKIAKEKLPEEEVRFAYKFFEEKVNELIHTEAIENGRRPDGRGLDEIRDLYAKAGGISPILHGSGIFYRGGTHVLSVLTLGGPGDSQTIDGMEHQTKKRFMHHYNFPPFSTGETGRIGGTNRRMIGHGALAEKALMPVLPSKDKFPYTIRIVSEALSSNGSTSMGSVCGGTIALMDAGVPISKPVAGIASGLMMELKTSQKSADGTQNDAEKIRYKILTDIQGPEDHHGDMDFKVAGTKDGITAVQMDVKVGGIPLHILEEAFEKAREARLKILDVITKEIAEPRKEISPKAPKIVTVKIKPDQIGLVIGSGGKTVNEIREKTQTEIDIDEDGTVFITGKDGGADEAAKIIAEMTKEYLAGETYEGVVVKITDFGAFVRIGSNTEGLVHVSEIAPWRINNVSDVLKEGMRVPVIIKEVDERGRLKLSIKDRDPNFIKKPETK